MTRKEWLTEIEFLKEKIETKTKEAVAAVEEIHRLRIELSRKHGMLLAESAPPSML